MGIFSELLLQLLFLFQSALGGSMITTDKVFADPRVAQLANAAQDGDLTRIEKLIKAGTPVKFVGQEGMTVTHYALRARRNAPQVMELLLKAGADPVSILSNGKTVPHYAVARNNADPKVVKVLLAHGIGPNWFPPSGVYHDRSMLQAAIMGRNLQVIKLLVERGADINYVDPFSGSALHMALDGIDFYIPAYLVEAGIDLKLLDSTSPEIKNPRAIKQTAIEKFCQFQGGRRGDDPLPEAADGWRVFTAALAKRSVTMPCGL
ncbi:ankyrin repeat domain-containing protein [Malikia spinosa]|uniref:ankyrin repeat domain-containing protein n=1 Tax=Malikia spinosa TaxID=86180 RepID=UPI0026C08E5A